MNDLSINSHIYPLVSFTVSLKNIKHKALPLCCEAWRLCYTLFQNCWHSHWEQSGPHPLLMTKSRECVVKEFCDIST